MSGFPIAGRLGVMRKKSLFVFSGWIIAGAAMGVLGSTVLFNLWFRLGWRRPVARWLLAHGAGQITGYWDLVWLHLVDWLIVGSVSVAAALFVRRQLVLKTSLFCLSYVLAPFLISIANGYDPFGYGPRVFAMSLLSNGSSIALGITLAVLLGALRSRSKTDRRGFGLPDAGG